MSTYEHATGKKRAEQEYLHGPLTEHPLRKDFVDRSQLTIPMDANLRKSGVPVPENAPVAAKNATMVIFTVNGSGATTDLANSATRVITATLVQGGVTKTSDSSTVVTFAKDSGAGTVSGTGNATVTNGVATKTLTATGTGPVVIGVTAPGYAKGTTVSFTIV